MENQEKKSLLFNNNFKFFGNEKSVNPVLLATNAIDVLLRYVPV